MGQSNSRLRRNRALSSSSTTQIRSPPLDNEPSQPTTDQNDSQQTLRPHPRAIRFRPAIRRSVMGLVSRSSSDSLAPPAPPKERATKAHFLRKRWRSARRLSKATSTSHLPHSSADTHQDISPIDPPPDHSHREDISLSESGPSSSSTLLRASRPSTPFPLSLSRPPTPRIDVPPDDEALSEEERRLSQNIGTWLSGSGPSSSSVAPHDGSSLTTPVTQDVPLEREPSEYLSAHSHPNSEYTPPHSPTDTSASNPPPPPVPTEQPPQPQPQLQPRHFPPPGTLVVVQGVVNTTDAPPAPTPSRPHHSSAPRPPTDPALLAPPPSRHRRSASAPRSMNRSNNLAEERSAARTGLSSLLPRPNSMITRRPSTESASSNTQASSSQDLLSSEASTSAPSSVTTPEASSSHINEQRDVSSNETSDAHRPLSPGSIDVLGTLLRYESTILVVPSF